MLINKKIKIPFNIKCSFVSIENSKILVSELSSGQKKYLQIPSSIQLNKSKDSLVLSFNEENLEKHEYFLSFLENWLKGLNNVVKKRLVLKGLGFKINISDDLNFLELKLGFSHIVKILIPHEDVKVSYNKNILTVEGVDASKVGNFVERIRNLKFPDSYKGKGFWHKNEQRVLKEIKKT